ncbi:lactadherin-like [Ylistrum balloti]|uniref:lactadherin-like n=1 Tax=Ylistrum balloti TaxID=509963 RepID=UPI00290580A1|nr:lactadherin-like [Ylistrum balloti]
MLLVMEFLTWILCLLTLIILCRAGNGPCDYNLVTGPYGVSDDAFTASSTHPTCPLVRVRFSSSQGWCPASIGDGHYLQVKFQTDSTVKAIQTRGRGDFDQWISLYQLNISMDGNTWSAILNATTGNVQIFPGNNDRDTVVTNTLEGNVVVRYIRVISVSGNTYRSMRLEIQGCPFSTPNTCNKWKAKLGSVGDIVTVVGDTNAANQGLCGLKCFRQTECDSFLFDVSSFRCRLLKETPSSLPITVNLDGVWYFSKT